MAICITVKPSDLILLNYLRRFMARYYASVEIRQGWREQIDLERDASDIDIIKAWLLLESAHSEFWASQEQTDHAIEVPQQSDLPSQLFH